MCGLSPVSYTHLDDELYTFTCDEEYGGGYDQDLGCWFDMELFQLSDEEVSLLSEWLNAKSVTAVFVGRDGTTQSYALTKENRTAIQEMCIRDSIVSIASAAGDLSSGSPLAGWIDGSVSLNSVSFISVLLEAVFWKS